MSESNKAYEAPRKKVFRSDEVKAALRQLDRQQRAESDVAVKAAEAERKALRESVLQRVGDIGRRHQAALAQLRDGREKRVRAIDKEYEEALRRAKGDRVRALNDNEATFARQRDEANAENTAAVAPCEAEMRDTEKRLATALAAKLAALRNACDEAMAPLIAEQQEIEDQAKARAAQAKAPATDGIVVGGASGA